jgi:sarcosine oxidase subunit beta
VRQNDPVEVAIVGAGVMGASIAFHLAERRVAPIQVFDRGHVGCGASGPSSALVRMHYAFAPEVRLARLSLDYFEAWGERLGRPTSFRRTGYVRIVPATQTGRLRANVAMQRACGVDTRLVAPDELREIAPEWRLEDVALAAWEPRSGYGDGVSVATDFLDRARELGASYRPRCRVGALRIEGGRVRGVETDAGFVAAGTVVVAAGAWSRGLLAGAGIELPLESEHHHVVVLQRRGAGGAPHPACGDSSLRVYFRPEGRAQTLVGGFSGPRSPDPAPTEPEAPPESLVHKLQRAARRMPELEDAGIVRSVSGYYTMTPDTRALIGPVPGVEGLFCCTGFSGMGFKLSPAVGRVVSEQILDGEAHSVDVSRFRVDRFVRGEPIRPENEYDDDAGETPAAP